MMDSGKTLWQSAQGRKEIELLRDQIGRDRILLAGKSATLMFLDQSDRTLDQAPTHPYPGKIWISEFASWSEPARKFFARYRCKTKDGAAWTCYDVSFSGYDQAKERFFQHASACGELLLPEADIPTSELLKELFEFCRSAKLLKWDVNEQPGHPETRRNIAWLHDVFDATVRFLNQHLDSQVRWTETADDSGKADDTPSSTPAQNVGADSDDQETPNLQRCQWQAYYAAKYVEAVTEKEHCEAKEVWDWCRNNEFDPNGADETMVKYLTGYEVPDNFATFESHWTRANTATKENRHSPRRGRKGHSVVKADEV